MPVPVNFRVKLLRSWKASLEPTPVGASDAVPVSVRIVAKVPETGAPGAKLIVAGTLAAVSPSVPKEPPPLENEVYLNVSPVVKKVASGWRAANAGAVTAPTSTPATANLRRQLREIISFPFLLKLEVCYCGNNACLYLDNNMHIPETLDTKTDVKHRIVTR
jgi:hypothetical protein